jgi:hypothetical protein
MFTAQLDIQIYTRDTQRILSTPRFLGLPACLVVRMLLLLRPCGLRARAGARSHCGHSQQKAIERIRLVSDSTHKHQAIHHYSLLYMLHPIIIV